MDATKIHLAERPPVACASCRGQYTDRQHVDFGADYDGPVLNAEQVIQLGTPNVQIDELVICDECMRAGAALLGLADNDRLKGLLADMNAQLTETGEKLRGALAYVNTLETQIEQRDSLQSALKPASRKAAKS